MRHLKLLLLLAALFFFSATELYAAPMRIIYGFDREFPPFSYEAAGGEAVGFEVELVEAIFEEADVTLVKRPLQWDILPLELSSGTITLTTGMIKNEQRSRLFLFSEKSTFPLQIRLFTKVYKRFPGLAMFRGQTVAVEQASFQHRLLDNFGGINIKSYKNKAEALQALYYDSVSAFCGPVPNTYYYINKFNYGAITTVGSPLSIVPTHIAVNHSRGDVLRLVNQGLDRIFKNGEYNRIYRKWFVRELKKEEQDILVRSAVQGRIPAYAPYTGKSEGAAILTATGKVFTGCTVENADTSLYISALTSAVAKAVSEGEYEITAVAIVDSSDQTLKPLEKDLQILNENSPGILIVQKEADGSFNSQMVLELYQNPVFKELAPKINF